MRQHDAFAQIVIIRNSHAAVAGGHVLALLEGVAPNVADGAGVAAVVRRHVRLGAVLDHEQVVLAGQFHDRTHHRRVALQVHHHDGNGAFGDAGLYGLSGDDARERVYVGENRHGKLVENGDDAADVRNRRDDNFVPRVRAYRQHAHVQRGGAGGAGDRMLDTEGLLPVFLEVAVPWGHPAR